jgi:DNA-binding response OmpR family regulator
MARYTVDMKREFKILLSGSKGLLYEQATKAFAKGRYEIATVARPSLKRVIETVELEKPDVILLDISMPSVSGRDVMYRICKRFPDTPVILGMTATRLSRNMVLARSAADVVVEPYEPAELRMRVERSVSNSSPPTAMIRTPAAKVGTARLRLFTNLHDSATGRIDASKLALYLGISLASLANAISKDYKAVFKTPASESLQTALAPIHRTVAALHRYFDRREESLAWLNTANPELGAKRPKDLLLEGKAEIVADMLEGALAGVTA